MAGDTINITLQVSEQIATSTIQILNNDITMIVNNDTASATVTVLQNSQNGPVEFTITAYDKTGNVFNVTPENVIYWKQCQMIQFVKHSIWRVLKLLRLHGNVLYCTITFEDQFVVRSVCTLAYNDV